MKNPNETRCLVYGCGVLRHGAAPRMAFEAQVIPVEASGDVVHVQHAARGAARARGFPLRVADELAIVASELATNILKYGRKGGVTFGDVADPVHGPGLEIVARDLGPPFRDFAAALADGNDDAGPIPVETQLGRAGLGTGLGAVTRFSDQVDWLPLPTGKEVRAVRYLTRRKVEQ